MRFLAILFIFFAFVLACGSVTPKSKPTHEHHGHRHHRFDDPQRAAAIFDDPQRDAWQKPDEVVAAMQIEKGMRVADIGAGTGYFLAPLVAAVGEEGHVLALDIEPKLIEYMTERAAKAGHGNVIARQVDADAPVLGEEPVDRILIVDTWHHFNDREAYARRLFSQMPPGASVLIVDFDKLDGREREMGPPDSMRLRPEVVEVELRAAGFVTERVAESLAHQYIIRATVAKGD